MIACGDKRNRRRTSGFKEKAPDAITVDSV